MSSSDAAVDKRTRKAERSAAQKNSRRIAAAMRKLDNPQERSRVSAGGAGVSGHKVIAIVGDDLPDGYLQDDSCSSSSDDGEGRYWDTSSSSESEGHDDTPAVIVSRGGRRNGQGYLQDSSDTSSSDTSSSDCEDDGATNGRVVGQAYVRGKWVVVEKTGTGNGKKVLSQAPAPAPAPAPSKAPAGKGKKSKALRSRMLMVRYGGKTWTKKDLKMREEDLREQIKGHLVQAEMAQKEFENVRKLLMTFEK